jgi:hypothetical protein
VSAVVGGCVSVSEVVTCSVEVEQSMRPCYVQVGL